ncbi:MAG: hypothetical protein AAB091_02060 [Elusimicrobiota bacterium]
MEHTRFKGSVEAMIKNSVEPRFFSFHETVIEPVDTLRIVVNVGPTAEGGGGGDGGSCRGGGGRGSALPVEMNKVLALSGAEKGLSCALGLVALTEA